LIDDFVIYLITIKDFKLVIGNESYLKF